MGSFRLTGRISAKELRKDPDGKYLPVLYITPLEKSSGEVQVYLSDEYSEIPSIGEYVCVEGKRKFFEGPRNPGEFDSRLYYLTLKISYRITNGSVIKKGGRANSYRERLFLIKCTLEKALDLSLSPQDAGVMKAMLLGDKAFMDEEIKELYKSNGIYHAVAISGLHISLIGMGLYKLLRRLMLAKHRIWVNSTLVINIVPAALAIFFMYSYGIMCGMGTSSFRAILMFALRLMAPLVKRTYDVLSALTLAEILMILDQPLLLYSSGFLFSFGAVIGITVVRPYILPLKYLERQNSYREMKFADDKEAFWDRAGRFIVEAVSSGAAVALVTLPVYGLFYYTYPIHSVFLNLFVIPVMGILLMLGFTAMSAGLFAGVFGPGFLGTGAAALGLPVHLILSLFNFLCSSEAIKRSFTWYMGCSKPWQVAVYFLLVGMALIYKRKILSEVSGKESAKYNGKYKDLLIYGLIASAVFILTFHIRPQLEINLMDVGQGDGILVSAGKQSILIDGGSTSKKNVGKYRIIPVLKYKGIGVLEAVVITHEDTDHVSGIFEIFDDMEKGGITVKRLILPEVAEGSRGDNYHKLENRAKELGIPTLYINAGESLALGNASFTCLNPELNMTAEGANEYSTVLLMKYRQFTALFTGDMEGEGLEQVKRKLRQEDDFAEKPLTLLKVAHHGSGYTTDEEFLDLTRPRLAIISCGVNNSYGHPHKELLERLEQVGAKVYRTDEGGCVSVRLSGDSLKIDEYCK
ncbi:MAG: DNA internalization-related competence protein ComEC/Rec2 [Butyrivibrio sp.]|nr:DNA internalization-related competence protein ComEC/Rec2 [Butyrivibrio sp.]